MSVSVKIVDHAASDICDYSRRVRLNNDDWCIADIAVPHARLNLHYSLEMFGGWTDL